MARARDLFQKFRQQGEAAIDEFIADCKSEELFLDFKRATDGGGGTKLRHGDRANLAKAISGFGNSEGGLIVWGVTCTKDPQLGDIPTGKQPVKNPKRFVSWLEGAVSGCTLPPHSGVQHIAIERKKSDDGFVLTYIPSSMLSPHQCIVDPYRHRYYIRVGSNFDHAPHGVLAGMFGKRPVPNLWHSWNAYEGGVADVEPSPRREPYVRVGFVIRNCGVSLARDVFVNLAFMLPGPECALVVHPRTLKDWSLRRSHFGYHLVAQDGYRLAPMAFDEPMKVDLFILPPFETELSYEITYGCDGSPVRKVFRAISRDVIEQSVQNFNWSQDSGEMAKGVLDLEAEAKSYREVDLGF